jgi:hypothetical protein
MVQAAGATWVRGTSILARPVSVSQIIGKCSLGRLGVASVGAAVMAAARVSFYLWRLRPELS